MPSPATSASPADTPASPSPEVAETVESTPDQGPEQAPERQPDEQPEQNGFVHLHVHTEHSPKDGISRVKTLVKRVAEMGMPAVAMTDHGTKAGAWKFVNACKAAGIKPILGEESYLALVPDGTDGGPSMAWDDPGVRFAKFVRQGMDAETGEAKRVTNNHITLLALNESGWRNLCAMGNAAEESYYYKPLIDYALIKKHGSLKWVDGQPVPGAPGDGGIVVLTGCLGGPVASHVAAARADTYSEDGTYTPVWDETTLAQARDNLAHLIECVGRDNVYVEVMDHGLRAEGVEHIKMLMRLAEEAGVKVVATNDSHFDTCEHHHAHDAWLASGQNVAGKPAVTLSSTDRWRFNGEGYWVRSEAEMRALFPKATSWQVACDETVALAERVQGVDAEHPYGVIPFVPLRLPRFPVPADVAAEWDSGAETTALDIEGREQPARLVDGRAYRSASALYLHRLIRTGRDSRYDPSTVEPSLLAQVNERLKTEFDVITGMGLEDYFLIVSDVIAWCRSDRGLPVPGHPEGKPGQKKRILVGPGRGSAAGSMASYCLRIVMVDPLRNGLLFERFLDVARIGMPDIDVDFETDRRGEVYEYLSAKYGREYVARIGAFQMSKSKSAIKDAARLLEKVELGNRLANLIPVEAGSPLTFAQLDHPETEAGAEKAREFKALEASEPGARDITDLARSFEAVVKGDSIHAAGVIISDEPLTSLIPMRLPRKKDSDETEGNVPIALWDGKDIDSFGMLKLDALSLRNLDVVSACVENIEHTTGEVIDPDDLPDPDDTGDPRVDRAFALLRAGKTEGVFQLESSGITELTERVAPTTFSDLSAILALYRPGPMGAGMHHMYADRKNGREPVDYGIYTDDSAEQDVIASILGDTFGTIVYQEQVMFLAEKVAGFTADEKNRLRKAFSKKDRPAMEALKATFVGQGEQAMTLADGTPKIAFRTRTLENLWVTFDAAAEYLFNKSHTIAYGHLSYVTAYLKANYPGEYGAALLARTKDQERRLAVLSNLAADGLTVAPPDVNLSAFKTAPSREDRTVINLGLGEVVGVKANAAWIIAEREKSGRPFTSMEDLTDRVKVRKDGKESKFPSSAVEGLIEAGAFDRFGPRLGHMMLTRATGLPPEAASTLLIGPDGQPRSDCEWGPLEKAARQRARLNFATGEHPVVTFRDQIQAQDYSTATLRTRRGEVIGGTPPIPLEGIRGEASALFVYGLLTGWSEKQGKRGRFAQFTLESETTHMDGVMWPEAFGELIANQGTPAVGSLVVMWGQAKTREVVLDTVDETATDDTAEVGDVEPTVIRKTELTAYQMRVISVHDGNDSAVTFDSSPTVGLASVIDLAKERAERGDFATAAQKKKAAAAAAKAADPDQPSLLDDQPARPAAKAASPAIPASTPAATPTSTSASTGGGLASVTSIRAASPAYRGTIAFDRSRSLGVDSDTDPQVTRPVKYLEAEVLLTGLRECDLLPGYIYKVHRRCHGAKPNKACPHSPRDASDEPTGPCVCTCEGCLKQREPHVYLACLREPGRPSVARVNIDEITGWSRVDDLDDEQARALGRPFGQHAVYVEVAELPLPDSGGASTGGSQGGQSTHVASGLRAVPSA